MRKPSCTCGICRKCRHRANQAYNYGRRFPKYLAEPEQVPQTESSVEPECSCGTCAECKRRRERERKRKYRAEQRNPQPIAPNSVDRNALGEIAEGLQALALKVRALLGNGV